MRRPAMRRPRRRRSIGGGECRAAARARVVQARLAPFDGIVTARNTDIGRADQRRRRIRAASCSASPNSPAARLRAGAAAVRGGREGGPERRAASSPSARARPIAATVAFDRAGTRSSVANAAGATAARQPEARAVSRRLCRSPLQPGIRATTLRLPVQHDMFRGDGLQVATVGSDTGSSSRRSCRAATSATKIEVLSGIGPDDDIVVESARLDHRRCAGPAGRTGCRSEAGGSRALVMRVAAILFVLADALAGCSLAPRYQRPASDTPPPAYREASDWKLAAPADAAPRGPWWTVFRDPALDALESQVTDANQDLKAALARLQEARAQTRIARAGYLPKLTASAAATRSQVSVNGPRFHRQQADARQRLHRRRRAVIRVRPVWPGAKHRRRRARGRTGHRR